MAAERTVRVKFDGSSEGLVRAAVEARAAIKALADDQKKRTKALNDLASSIGKLGLGFVGLAKNVAGAAAGLNLVPVAVQAIVTAAGALPLVVAGGFAFAAALTTIKLGADGAKKAFEALNPQLDALKSAVSTSFEQSLAPAVSNLQRLLPQLTVGFKSIASAMGGVATKVTAVAASAQGASQLKTILDGTSRVIQNLGKFLAPVTAAFLRIGAVAMPILVGLTSNLGAAGDAFNQAVQHFADSGNLEQWINSAIQGFKSFFDLASDVVGILNSVIGAISDAGGGSLGFIGPLLKTVREFLDSAEGHDTLVGFFQALNQVAGAVSQTLGAALKAVAPVIPPLAQAFASLATTLSGILIPVINFLAPVLANIANFIAQNVTWIKPLVIALGLWAAAQWVLNAAMDANPIGLVIIAIGVLIAIVATIITYWQPIADFFVGLWNTVKDAVTAAASWVWDRMKQAWAWVVGVWNGAVAWFQAIWTGIKVGVSIALDTVKNLFSSAWNTIKGVWASVGHFFSGIWSSIGNGLKSALNGAIRLLNGAIHGINAVSGVVGIPAIPNIPLLARGGTAKLGRPYIVGERGPELFVPGQTGRVVSHSQSFGGGPSEINLTVDLGDGFKAAIKAQIDENGRQVGRAVASGIGGVAWR